MAAIEESWKRFKAECTNPVRCSAQELGELRVVFFAGALAMLSAMGAIASQSDEAINFQMDLLDEELDEFVREMKRGKL
jgi:hypothetical protein